MLGYRPGLVGSDAAAGYRPDCRRRQGRKNLRAGPVEPRRTAAAPLVARRKESAGAVFQASRPWRISWLSWFPFLFNVGYHHIHGSPVYLEWSARARRFMSGPKRITSGPIDTCPSQEIRHEAD